MLKKNIAILFCLLSAVCGGALALVLERFTIVPANAGQTGSSYAGDSNTDFYTINRYHADFKFISPILSVQPVNESEKYLPLKEEINSYIRKEQQNGLSTAAVYFKDLYSSKWFSINAAERYDPGSLLKVGVLITYMRMAEKNSKLLDTEVVYHGQKGFIFPVEHYMSDTVTEGHKYRIRELLQSMIKYSDNRATLFLEDHMDTTIFKKEFDDLGITEPRFNNPAFTLNVKEYSMMFNALYNAGYLKKLASENSLSLLAQSVFKEGLRKGIPDSVVIAHKYGEFGNRDIHELHESGIVYLRDKPYLLTVMTRGADWNELSAVIGNISKMVYDHQVRAVPQHF